MATYQFLPRLLYGSTCNHIILLTVHRLLCNKLFLTFYIKNSETGSVVFFFFKYLISVFFQGSS